MISEVLHHADPAAGLDPSPTSEAAEQMLREILATPRHAPSRRHLPVRHLPIRRVLLGVSVAGAAAAVALGLAATPAEHGSKVQPVGYTVQRESDGSVEVEVDFAQFDDPAALQQSLDEQGVPSVVLTRSATADPDLSCSKYTSWEGPGPLVGPDAPVQYVNGATFGQSAFVLHPDRLPDDGTFVLMFMATDDEDPLIAVAVGVAIGDPPTC